MGTVDRIARIIIAALILFLYLTNQFSGTMAIVLLIIAIIFVLTSFISVCPIYLSLGIRTNKNEKH